MRHSLRVFGIISISFLLSACSFSTDEANDTSPAPSKKVEREEVTQKEVSTDERKTTEELSLTDQRQFIKNSFESAKSGKTLNSESVVGQTSYMTLKQQLGEPDIAFVNAANFVQYKSKQKDQIAYGFGIGVSHILYEIRSFVYVDDVTPLSSISFSTVEETLGKPLSIDQKETDQIWNYKANAYLLRFVGAKDSETIRFMSVYLQSYDDSKQ